MTPTTAGGRELPRYMLDGVPPYLTLTPFTGGRPASGPPLARRWSPDAGGAPGGSDAGLELHAFTARPDAALSVCPLTDSPPTAPQTAEPVGDRAGGRRFRCTSLMLDAAGGPPGEKEVGAGSAGALRTEPDGEPCRLHRSVSLTEVSGRHGGGTASERSVGGGRVAGQPTVVSWRLLIMMQSA